jgi:streptogramin lyase
MRSSLLAVLLIAGAAQAQSVPTWRYTEELRIGSESDDATGFSDVRGLLVNRKGNIWIIEASLQEIRVFDPAGKHLRTVGRKGKGPGEFTYADGMAVAPDGLIWVHDPQNVRFSIFDQDGKYVRQQLAPSNGYAYTWRGGIDRQGRIWDQLFHHDPKNPDQALVRRASPDWTTVDTLALPECNAPGQAQEAAYFKIPPGSFISVPYYPGPVAAVDYNGAALWCAPTGAEYRAVRVGIERQDTLARLSSRAHRLPVSAKERDSAISKVQAFMKKAGPATLDWSRIPKVKPLLQSAFVDDDGRIWVLRPTTAAGSAFDLFSREGRAIATVTIPHPVNVYIRPVIQGELGYFVSQEEGEVPYVIRARIGPAR